METNRQWDRLLTYWPIWAQAIGKSRWRSRISDYQKWTIPKHENLLWKILKKYFLNVTSHLYFGLLIPCLLSPFRSNRKNSTTSRQKHKSVGNWSEYSTKKSSIGAWKDSENTLLNKRSWAWSQKSLAPKADWIQSRSWNPRFQLCSRFEKHFVDTLQNTDKWI